MPIHRYLRLLDSSALQTSRRTTIGARLPTSSGIPLSTTVRLLSVAIVCMSISILPTTLSRCAPANRVPRRVIHIICCASPRCSMPPQPMQNIWTTMSAHSSIISYLHKTPCKADLYISPQCAPDTIECIRNHRRASGVVWVADWRIMPAMAR